MYLTRACLANPIALFVGAILLFIFGTISLSRLPIQLTPELEEPEITISTNCTEAAIVAIKVRKTKKVKSTPCSDSIPVKLNKASSSKRYFNINQLSGTVSVLTKITALPKPIDVSIFLDIAKNEHIPKKYARSIFSINIDLVNKLK